MQLTLLPAAPLFVVFFSPLQPPPGVAELFSAARIPPRQGWICFGRILFGWSPGPAADLGAVAPVPAVVDSLVRRPRRRESGALARFTGRGEDYGGRCCCLSSKTAASCSRFRREQPPPGPKLPEECRVVPGQESLCGWEMLWLLGPSVPSDLCSREDRCAKHSISRRPAQPFRPQPRRGGAKRLSPPARSQSRCRQFERRPSPHRKEQVSQHWRADIARHCPAQVSGG